ncbi:MAG: hypothetical protein WCJ26_02645 [bacterium]
MKNNVKYSLLKGFATLSYILFFLMYIQAQKNEPTNDTLQTSDVFKSLSAATTVSAISFAYQAIGAGFMIGSYSNPSHPFGPVSVGAILITGGLGMELNNAQLTNRAYHQIQALAFQKEDSALQQSMLKKMKTAKNIAVISNFYPAIVLATSGIAYVASGNNSDVFNITFLSLYSIGIFMVVPEIILIEQTKRDLHSCQSRLSFGASMNGMGMKFSF